jgi:crotonobetainyl-CoA:carnitine CoA-transferase CaiB-like acyl-CoA transferase
MARIVDLSGHATAYSGRLLAEMGHDVIRVEPAHGDALRRLGPFLGGQPDLELGAYHQFLNAGKRSFAPNLACARGRQLLLELVSASQAVVGHLPLPVADEEMLSANRNLVVVRVDDGLPELCAYARSGLLAATGHPDLPPVLLGGHAAYAYAGAFAAVAVIAALLVQQTTGQGQFVDLSVQECLEALGEQGVVSATETGQDVERRGYRGVATAISGAFRCADGYAMLSVAPNEASWARFMEWVQDPVLMEDSSLADEAERRAKKDFVIDRLDRWAQGFSKEELVRESQARHTPAALVTTPLDLADDPQLIARGFLRTVEHPDLGAVMFPIGALANLRGLQPSFAPRLGQHNAEVLSELGYSPSQREDLARAGAI